MDSPLRARKQAAEYAMEASIISCSREIQDELSAGKLMLTVFWDSQGPILETYQECGTTVTSAMYCDMLQRELKPAIRSKRRGKLSKEILLLHDNAVRGCSWMSGALCIRHTHAAIFEHFNPLIDDSTRGNFIAILSTHAEVNLCSRHTFCP